MCHNVAMCTDTGFDEGSPEFLNNCCGAQGLFSYYVIDGGDCSPCKCKLLLILASTMYIYYMMVFHSNHFNQEFIITSFIMNSRWRFNVLCMLH